MKTTLNLGTLVFGDAKYHLQVTVENATPMQVEQIKKIAASQFEQHVNEHLAAWSREKGPELPSLANATFTNTQAVIAGETRQHGAAQASWNAFERTLLPTPQLPAPQPARPTLRAQTVPAMPVAFSGPRKWERFKHYYEQVIDKRSSVNKIVQELGERDPVSIALRQLEEAYRKLMASAKMRQIRKYDRSAYDEMTFEKMLSIHILEKEKKQRAQAQGARQQSAG